MFFEGCFALTEPAGDLQEGFGVVACDGECRVMEGVGLDEGSIEIDAEHRQGVDVECGGDGQKCPSLRLKQWLDADNVKKSSFVEQIEGDTWAAA
jgi:hypothetical protein